MKISFIESRFFISVLLFFVFPFSPLKGAHIIEKTYLATDSLVETGGVAQIGEKILDLVTWEKDGLVFTVYPSLSVSPRNGFVYGVMPAVKWESQRKGLSNTLTVNAETSTKGMLQLQFEHEWYFHEKWLTSGEAFLNKREDLFWIGGDQEDFYFDRREVKVDWDLLNNIYPGFWIGLQLFIDSNHFSDEAELSFREEGLQGFKGGLIFGLGPKLLLDTRERTLAPQSGVLLELQPLFVGVGGIGDYNFTRITVDFRKYVPLKQEKTTLAFQTVLDYAEEKVPFYDAPQLGGKERLRGIGHPLKRSGNSVWLSRVELRQHLWWRFGVAAFAGVGEAKVNYQNPFEDVVSSFGAGLRFRMLPDDPLNVRFDFGRSSIGTTGFFISLKEAF
ncbi:BamA/TamA family outer membrane protein [Marinilabilia rubra]|uniref:Bacterial surface antigen (D15) domain-containing protein n=1 Tax=Marinilabilia rubra TaxID=2162893 RepID=A0A2U2B4Q1_9BACT|nr:BamA/TamA family outer membrane protein [Marinilabilia rubra]PWD98033.1 hypothetical protein DDZ16_17720 [Marinilabilia rubra]